jgi:hypothetical protein
MATTVAIKPSGNAYIDGILSGARWSGDALTFSFPTSSSAYSANYGAGEGASFSALNVAQQNAVRTILAGCACAACMKFTEVTGSAAADATIRYGASSMVNTAWAYLPDQVAEGGDVWLGSTRASLNNPVKGNYAWMTIMHETGHALGLKHAHESIGDFAAMPSDHDSLEYTVMSYRSYAGATLGIGYTNGTWDYPQTYMMDDIRALQALYGAQFSDAGKAITMKWSPTTGELFLNGVGQGAPGGNKVFMTVWNAGATTTYDFSDYSNALKINLEPGQWTTTSSTQLALLAGYGTYHAAVGNIANSYYVSDGEHNNLIANVVAGKGNDSIVGNAIDNKITGGGGDDIIDGGGGENTSIYSGASTDFAWRANSDGTWTVTDLRGGRPDGVDTLKNVQFLQFTDKTVKITDVSPGMATKALLEAYENIMRVEVVPDKQTNFVADLGAQLAAKVITADAALSRIIAAAAETTSVATMTYQFFTGKIPSLAGLDYLVSPNSVNANNLNSTYYQMFNQENRYINFAVSLGHDGEGKTTFALNYGSLNLVDATKKAYAEIFGAAATDDKAHLILDAQITFDGHTGTRAEYFTSYGHDDLGTKAAMVGWLLAQAVSSDTGTYAKANDAFLVDLADGADFNVSLIGTYGPSSGYQAGQFTIG